MVGTRPAGLGMNFVIHLVARDAHVAQEGAHRMAAAGGGVILVMGSTNGLVGHPFYADYNASKAGLEGLTEEARDALLLPPDGLLSGLT